MRDPRARNEPGDAESKLKVSASGATKTVTTTKSNKFTMLSYLLCVSSAVFRPLARAAVDPLPQ